MNRSAAINKIEKIISRIDGNSFSDSDIEILFVTLREFPDASKNIFEIGSFVSHNHLRDKGLINDIMLRNHLLMNIHFGADKSLIQPNKNEFPKYLPKLISLQLKMFKDSDFKKLNLKGGQIIKSRKVLNNEKSYKIESNICKLTESIGKNEMLMINEALSLLNTSDDIDIKELLDDVIKIISTHAPNIDVNIIKRNDKPIFSSIICLMNNTTYLLSREFNALTQISIDTDQIIHVCGIYYVVMSRNPEQKVNMMSPVFLSEYKADDIFDKSVTQIDIIEGNIQYSNLAGKIIKIK